MRAPPEQVVRAKFLLQSTPNLVSSNFEVRSRLMMITVFNTL